MQSPERENSSIELENVVKILKKGGIVAYPTEAVWGLGCDPANENAIKSLLNLKQRPWQKGLILVGNHINQFQPFIQPLTSAQLAVIGDTWPGPNTWIVPAKKTVPQWLKGEFSTLAIRVSAHPVVQTLCNHFGKALVSTSANLAGAPPAKSAAECYQLLEDAETNKQPIPSWAVVEGQLGNSMQPTTIRDLQTGKIIRP